jgi:hypothetical protein
MQLLIAGGAQLLAQIPFFVVCTVAVVLAVQRWDEHRKASGYVVVGVAVLVVCTIESAFVSTWLPIWARERGSGMASLGVTIAIHSGAMSVVRSAGYALIVAAIFADRPRSSKSVG